MKKTIYLLKIGKLETSIIYDLKRNLEDEFKEFNSNIIIVKKGIKLRKSEFDSKRSQYIAPKLLNRIIEIAKNKGFFKILGILEEDIYSKNYNFIFGLAKRGSYAALISITHLRDSFYIESGNISRKADSKAKFNERILKEAKHELGHTFGLKHCQNICVMRFSNSLTDTDKKSKDYCESCLTKLKSILS